MVDHGSSQNRQSLGYRDLRTLDVASDGTAMFVAPKRLGRYHIVGELGRGAMGMVYEGHDPRINRVVAIKIIAVPGASRDEGQAYRARFIREAQAAGRLSHPSIVTIHDVDEDPVSRIPFIVMEYVPGKRLDTFIEELPSQRLPSKMGLDAAFLMTRYRSEFAMVDMPKPMQAIAMPLLYALGSLLGTHRKFKDAPESVRQGSSK